MTYVPPVFNLTLDLYDPAVWPPPAVPTFAAVPCQLYIASRAGSGGFQYPEARIPAGSVALLISSGAPLYWSCEIPPASNKWYGVQWCGIRHQGFPNEYWVLYLFEMDPAQFPNQVDVPQLP